MHSIDSLFEGKETTISRDLKLNLKRLLEESALSPQEAALTLLATAICVESKPLAAYAREKLTSLDLSQEQIQEAAEVAGIMGMLNMYYRFKHFISHSEHAADYGAAGLRMTSLARPGIGKDNFEMLAFATSVINGCEKCVTSHEHSLREIGVGADKIHELARLASVVTGIKALEFAHLKEL